MNRTLEEELKMVAKLNPRRITSDGYYVISNRERMRLTKMQIQAARRYFHDSTIASNVLIHSHQKSNPSNKNRNSKKYRLQRSHSYDNRRVRLPKLITLPVLTAIGVVLITSTSLMPEFISSAEEKYTISIENEIPESKSVEESVVILPNDVDVLENNLVSTSPTPATVTSEKEVERKEYIQSLCDIYQVNFDTIYNKLVEVTNNFEGEEYKSGHIAGVTCKGMDVYTTDEEALLLYFVRCAKQLPGRLHLDASSLKGARAYESGVDYAAMISRFSNILGCDRCLIYAIAQTETSWESELFREANNPAGLKLGDSWWQFDTKEEGFIELMLEIKKYNSKGAYSIKEIGAIHAPVEDGNAGWIPNVTAIYNYAKENEEQIFGDVKVEKPNVY